MKKLRIPKFKFEAKDFVRVRFPHLRPTLRTISIRLPEYLIGDLKVLANERDIPYQALLKQFLVERVEKEWRRHRAA